MRTLFAVLVMASTACFASLAAAEETERYRLERSEDGYIRMDTRTGAMSICEERSGQLVCRMAADERAALQDEIARLDGALKALQDRVAKLEKAPAVELPTDEQFDKTMSYMQRFFRGFMDMVEEYRDKGQPEAVPQRT